MGKHKPRNGNAQEYRTLFFTWCVPGIILVIFGRLSDRPVLSHFGMALLSIGILYYGKVKRFRTWWQVVWLALFSVYLALGFLELLK